MNRDVFISYARQSSRASAEALYQALGGDEGPAFLDTAEIEDGERFPERLIDALLGAREVVVFADETYFRRWYCLWEIRTALAPYLALPAGASESEKLAALAPLIIVRPAGDVPLELERLPPLLKVTQSPRADEVGRVEALVRARLATERETLGERLRRVGRFEQTRTGLLEESALPQPRNLGGLRMYPLELPLGTIGKSFVGRADELWRIDFLLHSLRGEVSGAAITGALEAGGGFGKTRLAAEYVHRLGPIHFPGGMFWVNADVSEERLEEQFHGILRTLRPEVPELSAFREQKRNAYEALRRALHEIPSDQPILYVIDNVAEAQRGTAPKHLRTWCPAVGKVSLLVTSRFKVSLSTTEAIHPLPVETLREHAAVELLTEGDVERSRLPPGDWKQIADWVGNLPLALELLNRAMRSGSLNPSELLAKAESTGPARELDLQREALRDQLPEGQVRGVTEALHLSYERLSPEAQRLARLLAQLSHEPVPMAVLETLGDELAPRAARTALVTRSFVSQVKGNRVPLFGTMHRVLADFLRAQTTDEAEELEQIGAVLAGIMEPDACRDPQAWLLMNACRPHAEAVLRRMSAADLSVDPQVCTLIGLSIGTLLDSQGALEQALNVSEQVANYALQTLGEEHQLTIAARQNLAAVYSDLGRFQEALALKQHLLEVSKRALGEQDEITLICMGNLAATLHKQGKLKESRELNERALEELRQSVGEENRPALMVMNNLAAVLADQGDLKGEQELRERALEICRRIKGDDHPETLVMMVNQSPLFRKVGRVSEAITVGQDALERCLRVLGREHPYTLAAMSNLSHAVREKDPGKARELAEEALRLCRRIYGEEHVNTIKSVGILATVYKAQGDVAAALKLEEEVLERSRTVLGNEHLETLQAMHNLAATLLESKQQLHHARTLAKKALEGRLQKLGEHHPETALSASNLFLIYDALGDSKKAVSVTRHLHWLAERPVDEIPAGLREIRELVLQAKREADAAKTGPRES